MFPGKLIEGEQAFPVIFQAFYGFGSQALELGMKLLAQLFAGGLRLGIRHRTEQLADLWLMFLGNGIEDVRCR